MFNVGLRVQRILRKDKKWICFSLLCLISGIEVFCVNIYFFYCQGNLTIFKFEDGVFQDLLSPYLYQIKMLYNFTEYSFSNQYFLDMQFCVMIHSLSLSFYPLLRIFVRFFSLFFHKSVQKLKEKFLQLIVNFFINDHIPFDPFFKWVKE